MTERKRLECRNFGNCLWNGEHNYGCDGHLPEWDGERHDCEEYEPMPDAKSLLELADEIDRKSNDGMVNPDPMRSLATSLDLFGYACRIREACGVDE